MRRRNQGFIDNIGELAKEIKTQDLEQVNGGKSDRRLIDNNTVEGLFTIKIGCEENLTVTREIGCYIDNFTIGNECL